MVEAADYATWKAFLESQVVKNTILDATASKARWLRIKLYDVLQGLSPETILADLLKLNLERGEQGHRTQACCRETDIKLTYRQGPSSKSLIIWVAEVSPEVRSALLGIADPASN